MRRYRLIPVLNPETTIEFSGLDPAMALNVASEHEIYEADLFEGERYLLTIRRGGAVPSCWTILKAHGDGMEN